MLDQKQPAIAFVVKIDVVAGGCDRAVIPGI